MRHFAAPKAQGDLHLVAFAQKLQNRAHLDVIVVLVGAGAKLDLFDFDDVLLFAGLSLALLLLIFEFAEIHDLADRRFGIWRNLNQIQPCLLSHLHCTGGCDHADIFAVRSDQPDFRATDTIIDTRACVTLRRGIVGSASYG